MAHMAPTGISPESPHSPNLLPGSFTHSSLSPLHPYPHLISSLEPANKEEHKTEKNRVSLTLFATIQKKKKNSRK